MDPIPAENALMTDTNLAAILHFLSENDGASIPRVAKQLALPQSELLRLLAMLGDDEHIGGLGLIDTRDDGTRRLLHLSDRGRAWLAQHA